MIMKNVLGIAVVFIIIGISAALCLCVRQCANEDIARIHKQLDDRDAVLFSAYCKDTGNPKGYTKEEYIIYRPDRKK